MPKIRVGLQIEDTSPSVRHLIGSGKGVSEWDGVDPDEIVKVTYTVGSSDIQEINPGIYYNIPTITTAKQGDTLFSDDGRLFVYDEAGSRWFLWYTFDNSSVKIHSNNTITGEGTLDNPLSVNTTLFSLKGDVNPLLKGVDNGDGTFDFERYDGTDSFTIYETRNISDVDALRNEVGRYDREQVFLEGYHSGIKGPGEGYLYWDAESIEEDNKGTIFKPDESLLEIDKCNLYFNGSNSYAIAQGDSIGLRNIQFPIRIKTRLYADQAYILGASGWSQTDYGASTYGLKWGVRWFYSFGASSWVVHFFVNAPGGGGVHNMTAPLSPDIYHLYDIQLVEDGPDIVLIVDGEERNRLSTWNKTPTDSLLSLRFKLGEAMISSNRMKGWVEYLQLGTEVWDFNECSGNTVTGTEGNILDLNNVDWETLYKGRWSRLHKDYIDVQDFGALGDGITNDTDALNAAGSVLSSQGGGILSLPAGTYVVGKQEFTAGVTSKAYTTYPIINISNCERGVVIKGNGSKLIAADGLRYGSFDPVTGDPYTPPSLPFTDADYAISAYPCMINISDCYSVHVSDLELNGNNENLILGGEYGDKGRQIQSDGIRIIGCYSVALDNIKSDYHPLDGIYYRNADLSATDSPTPLLIKNVDANYNGRQGFSNTGGILGTAINCNFSHTGKGGLFSSPGAGVDFEPAGSCIRKFTFSNCQFADNTGVGFVADSGNTADVRFLGCYFIGTSNWSLWADKPKMYYENCFIAGSVTSLYGGSFDDATIIKNSIFTDDPSYSPTGTIFADPLGVIHMSYGNGVRIEQCHLESTQGKLLRLNGGILKECNLVMKAGTEYIADHDFAIHLGDSTLIDCTITEDIQGTLPVDGYYIYVGGLKSIGKNTLISNNNKLQWNTWASWGWGGDVADNQGRPFNRIELSADGSLNPGNSRSIRYRASPPTSEGYITGDVVLNNQPSSGSPTGWICTVSGSTGVNAIFEPFGEVGVVNSLQPGDDITELNNNGVYLNEASHDSLPSDNPHSVNIQQTYDEGSPASTPTPDNVLTTEAGVVKTTPILNYNVFNQNIRNSVNVVGTTETTILSPTTGSLSLTTNDCAVKNSYELEITGELTWGGTTTGVNVILYVGTQAETISIPLSGTGTEPIKIEAKLDFLDGVDTARTCVFTGNIIHIDSTGATVYIPISETELTVDVSSGTTFDATFTGTDAIDEITVSKAMLNRVIS